MWLKKYVHRVRFLFLLSAIGCFSIQMFASVWEKPGNSFMFSDKSVKTKKDDAQITLREQVVPICWKRFDFSPLTGDFENEVKHLLLNANKYALNKSWNEVRKYGNQSADYLDLGGKSEPFIRPVSHQAFALGVSLQFQVYDSDYVGISRDEAIRRGVKMIRSLAYRHKANIGKTGWGDQWQSALWAGQVAEAAWLMWEYLTPSDQEQICRMTVHEANRFLDYKVPYFKDRDGKVIFKGDSKAEENAWNASVLVIAVAMMPQHANADQWKNKAIELQLSARSMPKDLKNRQKINGVRLNEILQGSNVENDGTVINHNRVHPDYMMAAMVGGTDAWVWRLAGLKMPRAFLYNGEKVYYALTDLKIKENKTIYVKDENGQASSRMYYPEGNDWGLKRQACYWLMDIMAHVFEWDQNSTVKALDWAKVRNKEMLFMQGRDVSGQYYQGAKEDSFSLREEWVAYHIAYGYMGLWMQKNNLLDIK